jgi:hypothetical protein
VGEEGIGLACARLVRAGATPYPVQTKRYFSLRAYARLGSVLLSGGCG